MYRETINQDLARIYFTTHIASPIYILTILIYTLEQIVANTNKTKYFGRRSENKIFLPTRCFCLRAFRAYSVMSKILLIAHICNVVFMPSKN